MTDVIAPTDPAVDSDVDAPFARLVAELAELGYEPDDLSGAVTYTATDGNAIVQVHRSAEPPRAVLAGASSDGATDWEITLTAATPPATQLLILYAALNTTNAGAAITAATAALGLTES